MTKARTLADNFAADINGITAGTGITGGGTSGTVTITNDMATTITAKGDLLAGTGNATYDNLAAGESGSTLLADSASSVGLRYQEPKAGNPIINSAFQVWQRGTSVALSGFAIYGADRWMIWDTANATGMTVTRQATNDTSNLPNIQYCARYQRNSGQTTTSSKWLYQSFESVNSIPFAGKTVTLSFYARAGANFSASGNALTAQVATGTGTDQNWNVTYTGLATPINQGAVLTTTWQRFSFTGTLSASLTELSVIFGYSSTGTAGANDYFEITGVQLEVGSVATPFKTQGVTLAGELALAQRYYQRMTADSTAVYKTFSTGWAVSTTVLVGYFYPPVTMRVTPSSVDYSTLQWADGANAGIAVTGLAINTDFCGNQVIAVDATVSSGLTQYRPYMLRAANSSTAYLGFSAEL